MHNPITAFAPLGRLYDPLQQLAGRVHRALTKRRKTAWTDDRGSVFVNDADLLQSQSPRSIVGTYDIQTPLVVIEADLRLALRQRARNWITDWNEPAPSGEHRRKDRKRVGRPRRVRKAFKELQQQNQVVPEGGLLSM
jgi:hypothetical protein